MNPHILDRPVIVYNPRLETSLSWKQQLDVVEYLDIAVVIPCYRNWKGLAALLESIGAQTVQPRWVIVNITCPTDDPNYGPIYDIAQSSRVQVKYAKYTIITNDYRQSVAQAWNLGMLVADMPCLIINDDIVFTSPDVIEYAVRDGYGMLVGKLSGGFNSPNIDTPCSPVVEMAGYSCFLIQPLGGGVGFFDPSYFPAYFEDTDYNQRIYRLGYEPAFMLSFAIHHEGSVTHKLYPTEQLHEMHHTPFLENAETYRAKWGAYKDHEAPFSPSTDFIRSRFRTLLLSSSTRAQRAVVALHNMAWSWEYQPTKTVLRELTIRAYIDAQHKRLVGLANHLSDVLS